MHPYSIIIVVHLVIKVFKLKVYLFMETYGSWTILVKSANFTSTFVP